MLKQPDTAKLEGLQLSSGTGVGVYQVSAVVVNDAGEGILVSTVGANIDSSMVTNSGSYGISASGTYPFTLRNSNLLKNGAPALRNFALPKLDAQGNWWGSGNGPAPSDTLGGVDATNSLLDSVAIQGLPPDHSVLRRHPIVAAMRRATHFSSGQPSTGNRSVAAPAPDPAPHPTRDSAPSEPKGAGRPAVTRARETTARIPASP